jgi:hypothetical protein
MVSVAELQALVLPSTAVISSWQWHPIGYNKLTVTPHWLQQADSDTPLATTSWRWHPIGYNKLMVTPHWLQQADGDTPLATTSWQWHPIGYKELTLQLSSCLYYLLLLLIVMKLRGSWTVFSRGQKFLCPAVTVRVVSALHIALQLLGALSEVGTTAFLKRTRQTSVWCTARYVGTGSGATCSLLWYACKQIHNIVTLLYGKFSISQYVFSYVMVYLLWMCNIKCYCGVLQWKPHLKFLWVSTLNWVYLKWM